jgi:peptide/nickel transport system substrate-binding protein
MKPTIQLLVKRWGRLPLFGLMATVLLLSVAACSTDDPTPTSAPAATPTTAAQVFDATSTSLEACPPLKPTLKVAGYFAVDFSPHPAETRFNSTHYTRLHQMPLFGADPKETDVDADYGVAESWEFSADGSSLTIHVRDGLTFNNGDSITAEDVAFSIDLAKSEFADSQINGTLQGIGITPVVLDPATLRLDFAKGAVTFPIEVSPMVFPLYVTSKAYHSNGAITQEAFDAFRANPLAAGPYQVVDREVDQFINLEAARRDPLLGCPVYERLEIRNIQETGTRVAQFQTGQQHIVAASYDLIARAEDLDAVITTKPSAGMIGLYIFQTYNEDNVFNDINVRKAAAYAIDKELIGDTIFQGTGITPWGCTWPPNTEISAANPRYIAACGTPYPYEPATAQEYLQKAGYPVGEGPTIRLEYSNSYSEEADMAAAMQPMLNAVGFDAVLAQVDRAERNRRRAEDNGHNDTLLFFAPGGRLTSLAGSYSVLGPDRKWGPKQDADVVSALAAASAATTLDEYTNATADLGQAVYDGAHAPGFFSSAEVWFASKEVGNWGLEQSRGRGPLNLAALVTKK